jgi:hypothetical protein
MEYTPTLYEAQSGLLSKSTSFTLPEFMGKWNFRGEESPKFPIRIGKKGKRNRPFFLLKNG